MARHTQYSFHGTNYGTLAAAKKAAQQYANDTGRKTYVSVNTLVESKQGNYTDYKMVELAPKSRKKNPTVSTSSLPIGTWQPAHAIRQNADGSVDILREKNSGRRANISEGFMAGGVFHPIRHSADYDASRVGEGKAYKKKRKKGAKATPTGRRYTPKKASTRPAMATSRREYGGDGSRYKNPLGPKYKIAGSNTGFSSKALAKTAAQRKANAEGLTIGIFKQKLNGTYFRELTVKPK